eukprot:7270657-Prymnesium_polylepis.2
MTRLVLCEARVDLLDALHKLVHVELARAVRVHLLERLTQRLPLARERAQHLVLDDRDGAPAHDLVVFAARRGLAFLF